MESLIDSPMLEGMTQEELQAAYEMWYLSFSMWAEMSGVKVDGYNFSFYGHSYLVPMYMDRSPEIVLMKSSQMGATIWMVLKAIHMCLYPEAWGFIENGERMPVNIGFYFPNRDGVNLTVKGRVEKIFKSTPELLPYSNEKSRQWKPIGDSALWFMYMGGTSTKDSVPLMGILMDEVRLMDTRDIRQAQERVSHSPIKYKVHASTAGYPKGDIHKLFLDSDQKWFHTICDKCGKDQVLPEEFPNCIAEHTYGPRKGHIYYICKFCRLEIADTQNGIYVPHGDPNHEASGYQISQLISHRITAREVLRIYQETDNIKEFWNAKLGMPYLDEDMRPVSLEMLESGQNVNPLAAWGVPTSETYMGIDQMSNLNYVWILSVRGTERRTCHVEIIEDKDPFFRCGQLMEEYNVAICVCSYEPNTNDALAFANDFPKRVYLAKEGGYEDMHRWNDSWKPKKQLRKAEAETYYKYRVFIDKYSSILRTLEWVRDQRVTWPDPNGLIQEATPLRGGRVERSPIMVTHMYEHLSCPVKEKEEIGDTKKERREYVWKWRFVGVDPHGLAALNFACTASTRKKGGGVLAF